MTTDGQRDHGELLQRALVALDEMEAKLEAAQQAQHQPIAIVGMGLRFPGGAHDPDSFWELLMSGRDAVTEVPGDRWDVDAMFDPDPNAPGRSYSRWGGFIDDVDRFDAAFFGISPREALSMDPQQRLLLEVAWHALENAGIPPTDLAGSNTGVFIGMTGTDYADLAMQGGIMGDVDAYFASGVSQSVAAGRLAYFFDFRGPAVAVDTACSSSLLATHLACEALRRGEIDAALASGVNLMLSPNGHIVTSQARMTSFEGRCKTFDASADGYVRGEGCATVVLKRLSDAVADGNRVLAVIRGTHTNQDGRSNGLTAPSAAAQEAVIRAALADAGVEPEDVGFVECHGTGTTLGDPIEVRALQAVFGKGRPADRPLAIQSVKTNIGHLEPAAGIAGLCKLVLSLQHGMLPTHLHLTEPNPYIPWSDIAIRPVTGPEPWTEAPGTRRIGGISSFGFSGTNVHMVVEQAADTPSDDSPADDRPARVYTVSARSGSALDRLAGKHAATLAGLPDRRWADAAVTANVGRAHLEERIAVVAGSAAEASRLLSAAVSGETSADAWRGSASTSDDGVVLLFTGQGSQTPGMGADLYRNEPAFKQSLDKTAAVMREISGIDLLDVMFTRTRTDDISLNDTRYTQPALFAYEVAMSALWRSWGVESAAVIGHSIGELAAAHVAGMMSLTDALRMVDARARLMQALPRAGGMAAVFATEAAVIEAVAASGRALSVAAFNGPRNVVISGPLDALEATIAGFAAQDVRVERLDVSHAFHSELMEPMLDEFERIVASVSIREPDIDIFSNVTGILADVRTMTSAGYWRNQVRQPVRFESSIHAALAAGYRTFLEVGPSTTLCSLGRACDDTGSARFVASTRRRDDEGIDIHRAVAALEVAGTSIDWKAYVSKAQDLRRMVSLPSYPFERDRFWHPRVQIAGEAQANIGRPGPASLLGHELRSSRLEGRVFETELSPHSPSWLAEHVVYDTTIVPATAMLELMRRAGTNVFAQSVDVADVQIEQPLVLDAEHPKQVQTIVDVDAVSDTAVVEVVSNSGGSWLRHARGRLVAVGSVAAKAADRATLNPARLRCTTEIDAAGYYDVLSSMGVQYGATFRGIVQASRCDGEVVASILATDADDPDGVHPVFADACLQALGLAMPGGDDLTSPHGNLYVPVGIERWSIRNPNAIAGLVTAHGRLRPSPTSSDESSPDIVVADLDLVDSSGQLVGALEGVRFHRTAREAFQAQSADDPDWYYALRWQPVPLVPDSSEDDTTAHSSGEWLVIGAAMSGFAGRLADEIRRAGATVQKLDVDNAKAGPALDALLAEAGAGVVLVVPSDPANEVSLPVAGPACVAAVTSSMARLRATATLTVITTEAMAVVPGDRVNGHEQAAAWGVGRVASSEYPQMYWRLLDVEFDAIDDALKEILSNDRSEQRVAWRGGVRYAPRLARADDIEGLDRPAGPYELQIAETGRLDGLRLVEQPSLTPGDGEVLIEVLATGLNFRDVLTVLGRYEGVGTIGSECAGVVTAVGIGVDRVSPGDRVIAVTAASFGSSCLAPQEMVTRIPDSMSAAEAATVPIGFLTAQYALEELGHMQPGERVLIHAATGGVGMAAVQLAQRAGLQIFATAGSDKKRDKLHAMGVKHVYDSRSLDFSGQILEDTAGEGVDLVLNSLNGDAIESSVAVLSDRGRFLEIGAAGIWTDEQFRLKRPQAQYSVLYLGQVCEEQPSLIARMLDQIVADMESGSLAPLPLTAFEIGHAADAFRYMAQARHIGKVVITAAIGWNVRQAGGAWIISGGIGGLGLTIAEELAVSGASRLVLCSRTAPSPDAAAAIGRIKEICSDVRTVQIDISDADAVAAVAAETVADGTALRGIVHAAAVLDDGLLGDMNAERFETVMRPKLAGARNLAAAVDRYHADHCVFFSAGAVMFGPAGQGNYVAANTALDSFALNRRAAGLPALSIAWGPWAKVGMAAGMEASIRRWESEGIVALEPTEGRTAFRTAIASNAPTIAVMKLRWPTLLHRFTKHGVPPLMNDLTKSAQRRTVAKVSVSPSVDFAADLLTLEPDRRSDRLRDLVQEQVLRVLGLDPHYPVGPQQGLSDLGMDSLMAVELSNRLSVLADRSLPSTLAFEHPTLEGLRAHFEEMLRDRVDFGRSEVSSKQEVAIDGTPNDQRDRIAKLAAISEEDAEESLLAELKRSGY